MIPAFDEQSRGARYCYTEYEFYSLDGEDIYINQLKQSNYGIQDVIILESKFTILPSLNTKLIVLFKIVFN